MYMLEVVPLPPVTSAHPVLPLADCCHWMTPVFPVNVMEVFPFGQTVVEAAVAVPPTLAGFTVTKAIVEFTVTEAVVDVTVEQTPLLTFAL